MTGLPALNLLVRLRKPPPLSPRRWSPGHKTRPGVKSRGRHERASQELEAPPQMGGRNPEALPPEGERECGVMSQGTPNEGTCEQVVLSTWEGPGRRDPGGGPTGEQILNSKRPVEAMDITAGIVAQKKNLAVLHVQCRRNHQQNVNHAPGTPIPSSQSIIPVLPSMLQPISVLGPMQRARHLLGRCRSRSRDARHPSGPYNNAPGNGRNGLCGIFAR